MAKSSKNRTAWDNPRDFLNMTDEQIIAQVVEDFKNAEDYQTPYLSKFKEYYQMYRAYIKEEDMREDGSNLFIPYIFNIVENAYPKITKSLFSVRPYIPYLPVNRKDPDSSIKAENMTKLVEWELDNKMKGRLVYNEILRNTCMYGTGISKQTWKLEERKVVKRQDVAELETDPETGLTVQTTRTLPMETTEITYDAPLMQNIPLEDFFFDPYATDIDSASYVIHRYYLPMYKILDMCKQGQLSISPNELKKKLDSSQGDNNQYDKSAAIGYNNKPNRKNEIEVLEYWTDDVKCLVLNQTIVGLVTNNPFWHRRKPFSKWECVPVSGEFYGIGIIEMCAQLQQELNTTRNQRIDNVAYALNRMYSILRTANIDPAQLKSRPNGFIEVDDHNDIKELDVNDVPSSAYTEETVIKNDMDVTSGVYNYTRGEPADRRETATTASILAQAGNDRFESQVLQIGWGGFSDSALQLAWLNRQYIDRQTEIVVVGDNGKEETVDISQEDIDVDLQIIPAPSSLFSAANKQIQQNALVQLSNILVNNPVVNQKEYLKRVFEAFDFSNPDALFTEEGTQATEPTMQEPTTTGEVTPGEVTDSLAMLEAMSNANTGGAQMTAEDEAFLQQTNITE